MLRFDSRLVRQGEFVFVFAVHDDASKGSAQDAADQLRQLSIAEHGRFAEIARFDLLQYFTSCRERFDEHSPLIGNGIRNEVQVLQRQGQKLSECAIVRNDAENGPSRAMRFQTTLAKVANRTIAIRGAADVNFAADPVPQPLLFLFRGDAMQVGYFADELMAGNAVKRLVATKDLEIGVANTGQTNANQRPAAPQPRQRF